MQSTNVFTIILLRILISNYIDLIKILINIITHEENSEEVNF